MRNPNRIEPILELVEQEWKDCPDLRLGQLLYRLAGGDPFYYDDRELAEELADRHDMDNPYDEMEEFIGSNPFGLSEGAEAVCDESNGIGHDEDKDGSQSHTEPICVQCGESHPPIEGCGSNEESGPDMSNVPCPQCEENLAISTDWYMGHKIADGYRCVTKYCPEGHFEWEEV